MKFYVTSRFIPDIDARIDFYETAYGPFESTEDAMNDAAKRWPNDEKTKVLVFDAELRDIPKSPLEKPEKDKRAPGNESNWVKRGDTWYCKECGAVIMAARVAHPVHDGPFPLSGSGECIYEDVGYCPNCERKPSFHGSPVVP